MFYEFPVKKEPDPPPVADNEGKMHAAGLLGQRFFKENSNWQKKMVTRLKSTATTILLESYQNQTCHAFFLLF